VTDTLTEGLESKRRRSESRRRKKNIHVRVDDDEYAQIKALAKRAALSIGTYLRDAGLKRRFTKSSPQAQASVVSQLGTIVEVLVALKREVQTAAHQKVIDDVLGGIRTASDALVSDLI